MEGRINKPELIRRMEAAGFNPSSLSFAVTGTHRTLIRDILKRKSGGAYASTIKKISEVLDCEFNDLMLHVTAKKGTPLKSHKFTIPQSQIIVMQEHDVRESTGSGTIVGKKATLNEWSIPSDAVGGAVNKHDFYLIRIVGDSMEPILTSGDRVVVDPTDTKAASPGLYCVDEGAGLVVKRLNPIAKSDPRAFNIMYFNDAYSDYVLTAEQMSIEGRVVAAWKRF